ncbi:MAG TPA: alpha/beta hydrolase [Acidimicrobiales bacterium]|nr:alpha/beta hydrolase [Acidimicrobiales bacterium]
MAVSARSTTMLMTAIAGALLFVSCTTSVPARDAATGPQPPTSGATAGSAARTGTAAPIEWHDCDNASAPFECATVPVPVDHDDPDGATLDLAVVKLPATDPESSIGPLLVNPGGPGGSGIDFVEGNFWPRALTDNFDLIGFDPRGVGASSPVDCDFDIEKLYAPDPAPQTPAAVDELESVSKSYVQACAEANAELLPHMSTRDVAADVDDLRLALGVMKINYLGYSYGTSIGQVYADTYPSHIRAMVLDGVVRLGQPGIEAARDQGLAFDEVFGEFVAECPSLAGCPDDPAAAFAQIRTQLRKAPIPTDDPARDLTSGAFQLGVGQALYVTSFWPTLAKGLQDAARGDGTTMQSLADQYLGREPDGSYGNQTDAYFAVSCLDWDWPSKPQEFIQAGRDVAMTSPYLAEGIITDYIRCAYWPTPPRPLTQPEAKGSPLIVVVSTTGDPATPYANGVDLAKELPKGALITKVGEEHTAYGRGDACVDDAVSAYLISLRPPKENLRCT